MARHRSFCRARGCTWLFIDFNSSARWTRWRAADSRRLVVGGKIVQPPLQQKLKVGFISRNPTKREPDVILSFTLDELN